MTRIELVIVRVELTAVPDERRLQIHVPTAEFSFRPSPEVPDRVRVAGAMYDEDTVAGPRAALSPRMLSFERPAIRREPEARARGEVDSRLRSVVGDDARERLRT